MLMNMVAFYVSVVVITAWLVSYVTLVQNSKARPTSFSEAISFFASVIFFSLIWPYVLVLGVKKLVSGV